MSLQAQLNTLRDDYTQKMQAAEDIRKKYEGKVADMTPDEESNWEKALDDAEKVQKHIERLVKEEKLSKAADQAFDNIVVAGDTIEAKDLTKDQKLQVEAFRKSLTTDAKYLSQDELKALTLSNPVDAGYLAIPEQFVTELIKSIDNATVMRGLCRNFPVTDTVSLGAPSLDTDVDDSDWIGENTAITYSELAVGKRQLQPHHSGKGVKISRPLIMKSAINPETLVFDRLGYKFGITEEKGFLTGNGVNRPLGIMTASSDGISTSRDYTGETSLIITANDLIGMFFTLKTGYANNATWLFNRDVMADLRKLKDAANNYVWQPFDMPGRQLVGGNPGTVLDRPYVMTEYTQMKTSNAWVAGNYPFILGDFRHYWIATSMQMQMQTLIEKYAEENQNAYIGRMWVDGMPVLEEAFVRFKVKA